MVGKTYISHIINKKVIIMTAINWDKLLLHIEYFYVHILQVVTNLPHIKLKHLNTLIYNFNKGFLFYMLHE